MVSEAEHGNGDHGVGVVEAEGGAGQESDLGVDRFDEAVGEVVLDGGQDPGPVTGDPSLELDEGGDPAAACPADPGVEVGFGLFDRETEDQPQGFLELVGAVEFGLGRRDPLELGLLGA